MSGVPVIFCCRHGVAVQALLDSYLSQMRELLSTANAVAFANLLTDECRLRSLIGRIIKSIHLANKTRYLEFHFLKLPH